MKMNITEAKELLKDDLPFLVIVDFADHIVKSLNISKDANILDIGTGEGNMAVTLGLNGYHVITGEPEDDNSGYSKKDWMSKAEKLQVDQLITFKPFSADDLPFEDDRFDAVFLFGCLHHMMEDIRTTAIKECIRTATPNGSICIFEPNSSALELIRQVEPEHPDAADPVYYAQGLNLSVEIKTGDLFTAFIFKKKDDSENWKL